MISFTLEGMKFAEKSEINQNNLFHIGVATHTFKVVVVVWIQNIKARFLSSRLS